jgi:hypothetical protein
VKRSEHHRATGARRLRRRHAGTPMTLFSLQSVSADPATSTESDWSEFWCVVERELRLLPSHVREAFEARAHLSEESCRAVARRHGVTPQTACNWAEEANIKLRPKLEAWQ